MSTFGDKVIQFAGKADQFFDKMTPADAFGWKAALMILGVLTYLMVFMGLAIFLLVAFGPIVIPVLMITFMYYLSRSRWAIR